MVGFGWIKRLVTPMPLLLLGLVLLSHVEAQRAVGLAGTQLLDPKWGALLIVVAAVWMLFGRARGK